MTEQPAPLARALDHAALGFRVFPVWGTLPDGTCQCGGHPDCTPGKHPISSPKFFPHGYQSATDDLNELKSAIHAGDNYGLVWPEGRERTVFILDVDGAEWRDKMKRLVSEYGVLPATKTTRTPSGGLHIYFEWPKLIDPPKGARLFGFLVRWPGKGYVVGPGSTLGDKGWTDVMSDDIAMFPKNWAMGAVASERNTLKQTVGVSITVSDGEGYSLPESIGEGERYDAIRTYVASRYNRGVTLEEMWVGVRDVLAPRMTVALTEQELRSRFDRTVSNMAQRLGPPSSSPEAQTARAQSRQQLREEDVIDLGDRRPTDFPTAPDASVFGLVAGEVVDALRPLTSASDVGMLMVLLSAWGGIFGTKTTYHGDQMSTLFGVLIGETGNARKGTTTNAVWSALSYALDPTPGGTALITNPLMNYRWDGLGSGEALVRILSEGGSTGAHGLIVEEEFERLLKKMKSGSEYQSTLDVYLRQVFDSRMVQHSTATRTVRVLPGYTTSILGNVTVDSLRQNVPPEMAQSGFANRFLWVPVRERRDVVITGLERYELPDPVADALRSAREAWVSGRREFALTDDAAALLNEYGAFLQSLTGVQRSMGARFHTIACRVALVHASMDKSPKVTREYVERGVELSEYSRRALLWAFSTDTGDVWVDAVYAAVLAAGSEGLVASRVWRVAQGQAPRVMRARKTLVDANKLVEVVKVATGGRPTEKWVAQTSLEASTPFISSLSASSGGSSASVAHAQLTHVGSGSADLFHTSPIGTQIEEENEVGDSSDVSTNKPLMNIEESPIEVLVNADEVSDAIVCRDYRAHQSKHRRIGQLWTCPECALDDALRPAVAPVAVTEEEQAHEVG